MEVKSQDELNRNIQSLVSYRFRTVQTSEHKLNELVLDFLCLLERRYSLYKHYRVNNYTHDRVNLCVMQHSSVEYTLTQIWNLLRYNPKHYVFGSRKNAFSQFEQRNYIKVRFVYVLDFIKTAISSEVSTTKDKMDKLIFAIFHFMEKDKYCMYSIGGKSEEPNLITTFKPLSNKNTIEIEREIDKLLGYE